MSFKARPFLTATLVLSLFIQTHIAGYGYASPRAKIAFTCFPDGNYEICVMDIDGGNEVRLTDDPAKDHEPSWSPDGRTIGYVSSKDLKPSRSPTNFKATITDF